MGSNLTVLMTVYNGGQFLPVAVESILNQTHSDFQFLIVDDASTDDSQNVVRSYKDQRIELICLERNIGQTAALNVGLRHASTPWIARMDADDYSAPTRLEEQMAALDSNPSLSALGTFAWTFSNEPGEADGEITTPISDREIKRVLLRGSPLIHGTMVASREALLDVGAYDDRYKYSADLELYDRLFKDHTAANLPRALLGIRQHVGQGSRSVAAIDESIAIARGRLSTESYSRQEASIIRLSLSRWHVMKSFVLVTTGNYPGFFSSLFAALRVSPTSFPWNLTRTFLGVIIPRRRRTRIKTAMGKITTVLRK